ncbi:MAG: helix-turn-helix transcriptional regulator [bacterium]|nr:helix-turn-helix transcriptional regulator [bacterium]
MQELDRAEMGKRIRQIRLAAGLRQWELARMLGTTQSAVHKYEHGVVPEPRRLVELSRIGGTSIEWVLTGEHWESGSTSQPRLDPEVLNTACMLREVSESDRAKIDEALRIIRDASNALEHDPNGHSPDSGAVTSTLREHAPETLRLLESAYRIHHAVMSRIARETESRLDQTLPFKGDDDAAGSNGREGALRSTPRR